MNMATVKMVAENPDKQWYINQGKVARILGYNRKLVAGFLKDNNIPFYRIGREKKYFLPEVMAAVEKSKWAEVTTK